MANVQRWMRGPLVALGLVLLGLVPLAARAQGMGTPTTLPDLDSLPVEAEAPDAGTPVEAEVDVLRTDAGFALEEGPRFEAPTLVEDSPARYPEALAAEAVAGTVRLELLVDEEGEVAEARLVEGVHPL
ncbi:MAG TPA: energy transducer TonB, partial [Myxococcaceae bacterium]|nr:energy transducer TonB [Myxococcaceae bacterium]